MSDGEIAEPQRGGTAHVVPFPAAPNRVTFNRDELRASSISTAARSRKASGGITPSTSPATRPSSRSTDALPRCRSTGSRRAKLARRQGAYSVLTPTGLILKRGPELDRVLKVLDKPKVVSS